MPPTAIWTFPMTTSSVRLRHFQPLHILTSVQVANCTQCPIAETASQLRNRAANKGYDAKGRDDYRPASRFQL